MAVVIAFRLAIALAPVGYRIVNGPVPSTGNLITTAAGDLWRRLMDPFEPTALLAEELSRINSSEVDVTDFTGTFEGRKVAIRWSRTPSGIIAQDQAQTTLHFLKIASGAPAAWVNGTDDAAVETAFGTVWSNMKDHYASAVHLDVYRWSKSGPDWDVTPAPYNPAYRVTEVDVAGTGTDSQLPPQVAMTITFKTSIRKRWGRCYLPAPDANYLDPSGRIKATGTNNSATALASLWGTFLNACTTAHIQPVVMSRAHDAYTTPKGHLVAAQAFTAYPITTVQVDDVFDVIRSRRYSTPANRFVQTITPAA